MIEFSQDPPGSLPVDFKGVAGTCVSGRLLNQPVKHLVLVGLGPLETSQEVRWPKVGAKAAEEVSGKMKGSLALL